MSRKKVEMIVTAAMLSLALAACGANETPSEETEETVAAERTEDAQEEEPVQTEEAADPEESEETEETEESDQPEEAEEISYDNMIKNGDFSEGVGNWSTYLNGGTGVLAVNHEGQLEVRIGDVGNLDYSVQAYYDGFKCDTGVVYQFSFDLAVDKPRTVVWRIQINGGDYHAYFTEEIAATEEMQHYEYELKMEEPSDPAPRLCFNLGNYEGDGDLGEHVVKIDNVDFHVVDASGKTVADGGPETPDILVSQVGYLPGEMKLATFRGDQIGDSFNVIDVETNESVFTGQIAQKGTNEASDETTAVGDFTSVTASGNYKIESEGCGESFPFAIAEDVYDGLLEDTFRMMYLQRCGVELSEDLAGDFAHPVCHDSKAVVYGTDQKIDVSGGWHDAGDYGRYVVTGAKTAADLLLAYEINPSVFTDDMDIPESGNGVSDVLDEVRFELEWMMKMQENSGGVYHKVTCANFPGTVLAQDETEELIISPVSNAATGDYAAVMAMASRAYKDVDADFAQKCLDASKKALSYIEAHMDKGGFKNPREIVTGEYPDSNWEDEYFWALAELYKTTGDSTYEDKIAERKPEEFSRGLGWADVGLYGMYAYLTSDSVKPAQENVLKDYIRKNADILVNKMQSDAYGSTIARVYPWGSNMTIANNGMLFVMAQKVLGSDSSTTAYQNASQRQLAYLLGNNANGYCFVTGYGSLAPEHTHHRPSQVLGKTMKGMLVGGPNSNLEDPYAKATLSDAPIAKCYADNEQSYSCNEVTVYWNSPLVCLLAATMNQ